MSQLGRIGGQVLTDNLLRAGVDLAFETSLLYFNVSTRKIGVKTAVPVYDFDVNSNIKTTNLEVTNQLAPANLRLNAPNTISTSVGGIAVRIAGSTIFHDRLATQVSGNGRLLIDGNAISSFTNQNIILDPNGSGTVEFQATTNVTGDVAVSGNTNVNGNLIGLSQLILGDQIIDTVTVNTDFTQDILPGVDLAYDLGKSSPTLKRWSQIHSPDWTNISTGAWPGSGLRPQAVTVSDQILIDGVANKISGIQSNEDVRLNPDTGIVYIESVQIGVVPPYGVIHTLNNPNAYGTSASDTFGISVALSDSYAVIGAANEEDAGGTGSGKAYIFNLSTGALLHTLTNPNAFGTSPFDFFGSAVAITDTYTVVGAPGESRIDENDPNYVLTGKAYIFNTVTGALLWTLDNPNSSYTSEDQFGGNVAISGNRVIISSVGYQGGLYSGRAYVFNAATGALLYTLSNPNPVLGSTNDQFSFSVAISDSYIIVGAPNEDQIGPNVSNPGKAYIYNASTGALLFTLNNPNAYGTGFGDNFGYAVAITDSYAVVGAANEDDAGGLNSGKVYIYNTSTGVLLRTINNPNAYGISQLDNFGDSLAISGTRLIVGVANEDDADGTSSGKAYIFDVTTGTLLYTLDNPNSYGTSANDVFGNAVAISSSYALVGAASEDEAGGTDSGKAYVFGQPALDQSIIKNLLNTPLIFTGTGIGYYNFTGTNAMVVPSGNNSQRRASPEVGETRWNTEIGYLECYDGSVWVISTGGGEEVTQQIMDDLGSVYTLIFG